MICMPPGLLAAEVEKVYADRVTSTRALSQRARG